MFGDTVQKGLPKTQKDLGLKVTHSNLCSEITLATNDERTAVCCLSSVNVEKFDEWKDNKLFIDDLMRMLDNVLTHFIDVAPSHLWRAVASAKSERSIGLGAMGFHTYLQSKNVPMESDIAISLNKTIFKHIHTNALAANYILGKERGEPSDMKGTGKRFAHMIAIAPNASSSIICGGVSPSIEPFRANAFTQKTLSGSALMKNPNLEKLLKEKGINNKKIWQSIITNKGSVAHLEELSKNERDTYKTAIELEQEYLVDLAADRQKYVCQAQSLNLFFTPDVNVRKLNNIHKRAWSKKLKTLYYLRSEAMTRAEVVANKVERIVRKDAEEDECLSCQA
tara:strand:- start:954 stop:1967 length:1014 start_codon:yes stop_codon:yes gene_type:complete